MKSIECSEVCCVRTFWALFVRERLHSTGFRCYLKPVYRPVSLQITQKKIESIRRPVDEWSEGRLRVAGWVSVDRAVRRFLLFFECFWKVFALEATRLWINYSKRFSLNSLGCFYWKHERRFFKEEKKKYEGMCLRLNFLYDSFATHRPLE